MGKIMEIAEKNNTEVHEHNDLTPIAVDTYMLVSFKATLTL